MAQKMHKNRNNKGLSHHRYQYYGDLDLLNILSKGLPAKAMALTVGVFASMQAHAVMMDFDFAHGTVITDQYAGVTISADRPDHNTTYAAVYDTSPRVGDKANLNNRDNDLVGPNWGNSNLASANNIYMGGALIVQENNNNCHTGVCRYPDDEGDRPAGSLYFDFAQSINSFGFDLIDVEGPEEYGADSGFFAMLYGQNGQEVSRIGFGSFVDDGINNAVYGNHSLNRIQAINLSAYGDIHGIRLNFGGSAAVDNVVYTSTEVPEPLTLALFALIGGVFAFRRKA